MDIGDIIYFLFVIAGIVYSVVKKSNSKKNKTQPRQSTPTSSSRSTSIDDDIEQFLRSINGETETTKRAQNTASQYNESSDAYYDQEEDTDEFYDDQPIHQPSLSELKKQQKQQLTQEEKELLNKEISANSPIYGSDLSNQQDAKSEFNLRKAVIYDAIMNRPKY